MSNGVNTECSPGVRPRKPSGRNFHLVHLHGANTLSQWCYYTPGGIIMILENDLLSHITQPSTGRGLTLEDPPL